MCALVERLDEFIALGNLLRDCASKEYGPLALDTQRRLMASTLLVDG
jgi:hypothetical protein